MAEGLAGTQGGSLVEAGARGEHGWGGLLRVWLLLDWRLGLHVAILASTVASSSVLTSSNGWVNCSTSS